METLITTGAFVAITAIFIAIHVARGRRRAASAPRLASASCPRCGLRVPGGSDRCPSCGVPLQAYELVGARVAEGAETAPAAGGATPHAIVRADTCVGCGACVAVCPEPGAIRLEGKIAIVDLDRCKGHGECARACPVGGIVVAAGAAVQRIETPSLDAHFETNVPGLYVVGELGGRGLIKNAINEGKIAVEEVARRVRAASRPDAADLLDVVVVGSGPAGLSAGLEALRQGLRYEVLERGDLSDTIRRYPRHKILMAEPVKVPLYGDLWVADASKESLLRVWQTIVTQTGLVVRTGRSVDRVERRDGWLEVAATSPSGPEVYRARHVVLALGRRGTPRRLEVPGEELPKVFYDVVEMEAFASSRVLVVGGGDSAIEVVVGLERQPGTTVILSYRGEEFTRIKDRNREHLEQARAQGSVEIALRSRVREIRDDAVVLDVAGDERIVPNDYVIVRAGGVPPFDFLRAAGVRIVTKEIAIGGAPEPAAA